MSEILTYEEIAVCAKASYDLGVKKIKLTGGEPLIRKHIFKLVEMLSKIGFKDISLTTNGSLLTLYVNHLKNTGLSRVTVSLDTLDPQKFKQITRFDNIKDVTRSFDALDAVRFANTKINTVVMRNYNLEWIENILKFALTRNYKIRFIEYMPSDYNKGFKQNFVSIDEVKTIIEKHHILKPTTYYKTNVPSKYYMLENTTYIVFTLIQSIKIKPRQHKLLDNNIHQPFSNIGG
ncbi:MAG: radical SAM protein [Desulfurella sp.]